MENLNLASPWPFPRVVDCVSERVRVTHLTLVTVSERAGLELGMPVAKFTALIPPFYMKPINSNLTSYMPAFS